MIITPDIIARMERSEEARLVASAEAAGLENLRVGGGTACFGGEGHVATQCAAIGLDADPVEGEFEVLLDFYRGRCERFEFKLAPTAFMGWRERVVQAAFHVPDFESQMVMDLNGALPDPPLVEIREVGRDRLEVFGVESTFRFCGENSPPGLEAFITASIVAEGTTALEVFQDGRAVAGCTLGVVDGVAWLSGAAVDVEYRGRGLHKAMQAYRLRIARELGCDIACQGALAGSVSQQNAQKSGFQIAYTRPTFLLDPNR